MTKEKYLFDLITTGVGDDSEQINKFVENFDESACDFISEFNKSLLQEALSFHAKYGIAKFLIEQKCNLDYQDDTGSTALMYMLDRYNDNNVFYDELIYLIINKGANVELYDQHGNQALWIAVMNAKVPLNIIELLLQKGSDVYHKNNVQKSPYDLVQEFEIEELTDIFKPYI